jgi:hypothetical protein
MVPSQTMKGVLSSSSSSGYKRKFVSPPRLAADDENNDEKPDDKIRSFINYRELEEIQMTQEELDREVKKYKLRNQIDSILNDPEGAPFDLESELKKVNGGISPPLPENSQEMEIEEKVHDVESKMYAASESKDFQLAQAKKNELSKMHIDDVGSVLQINSAFYKAFSNKDYDAMEELWLHDASAFCIHPSSAPLIGAKNVLNSWKEMFVGGNDAFQKNKIEPTNIRLSVKGTTAIITCDEEVYTKRFVRGRKRLGGDSNKNGMELVNKLVTTNIFRKVGGKWFMVHHHATWHHESDAAKKALKAQMTGPSMTLKQGQARSNSNNESNESGMTVEGMLGIPGHEGLGGDKNEMKEQKGQVRRIFRGSLSDLLGGGLSDILGSGGEEGGNDDEDNGLGQVMGVESIIIRGDDFGKNKNNGDMDGNLDNDEDDDDDDDNDDSNDEGSNNVSVAKGLPVRVINVDPIPSPESNSVEEQPKDAIRQNCIKTLRHLASKGLISQKQKRMLLTDIIINSAKGDYSMVEVAYDLLYSEGEEDSVGEEDFAEQCKVFASALPEIPMISNLDQDQQ